MSPQSPRHARAPASPDAARLVQNNTLLGESTLRPDLVALSRFEFEMDKGRDGTKVVMVEWDPSSVIAAGLASDPFESPIGADRSFGNSLGDKSWEVSWNGQGAHLPAADDSAPAHTRRIYYLLPPGSPVPPSINIKHVSSNLTWTLKTLPAIFPPSLGIASSDVGTRGVLHTSWAKIWLTKLQNEIGIEMETNGESVGLEMAMQERRWILDHFGVGARTSDAPVVAAHDRDQLAATPAVTEAHTSSPRSPRGGRLSEKLKGLRLNTSEMVDLLFSSKQERVPAHINMRVQDETGSPIPSHGPSTPPGAGPDAAVSLNAVLDHEESQASPHLRDEGDDLFALPMSPRSPKVSKSPSSFQ